MPVLVPGRAYVRWSTDFISGQLAKSRRFRIFNLMDDFTRECVLQIVDFSISGHRLARKLDRLSQLPKTIVCANGPERACRAMYFWSQRRGVKRHSIQAGKSTQNAFLESFPTWDVALLSGYSH